MGMMTEWVASGAGSYRIEPRREGASAEAPQPCLHASERRTMSLGSADKSGKVQEGAPIVGDAEWIGIFERHERPFTRSGQEVTHEVVTDRNGIIGLGAGIDGEWMGRRNPVIHLR